MFNLFVLFVWYCEIIGKARNSQCCKMKLRSQDAILYKKKEKAKGVVIIISNNKKNRHQEILQKRKGCDVVH
jgi:hypothetical protein